jgi:hypothetical protein
LLRCRRIRSPRPKSVDASDYAGRISGWNMRMDQVSSGRFAGRLVMIRLRGLEIIRETTTQALLKQGSAWPDALVFSLPLAYPIPDIATAVRWCFRPNARCSPGAHAPAYRARW